jgi:hypothetical protein
MQSTASIGFLAESSSNIFIFLRVLWSLRLKYQLKGRAWQGKKTFGVGGNSKGEFHANSNGE